MSQETVPAPPQSSQEKTRSQLALSKFGTIGYDVYVQLILAESARVYSKKAQS